MYPHERSLVKQLADKPFALIGVNSDRNLKTIRKVVKEKNLTWRSFQDKQDFGQISSDWGIRGWPTIFVLDGEGRIRYRDVRGDAMDKAVETLLAEMGHEVEIEHHDEEDEEEKDSDDENDESEGSDDDEKKPSGKKDK